MPPTWSLDPGVLATIGSAALCYAIADRRARTGRGPNAVERWRRRSFLGGLAVCLVALGPPVEALADRSFAVHMVQHLLLTMVAAPLLVVAAPVTLALRAWKGLPRRVVLATLHSPPVRIATSPLVAWALFFVVVWGTHFTGVYDLALRSTAVHAIEHVALLATAALFWMPVVGTDPTSARLSPPARILYLFVAMPAMAFLGLALFSAGHVLYPTYARVEGVAPALADQRAAGAIMWAGGMVLIVIALSLVTLDWMRADEREAARVDRRLLRAAEGAGMREGADAR
jgi:putative membrane protein